MIIDKFKVQYIKSLIAYISPQLGTLMRAMLFTNSDIKDIA